MLRIEIQSTYTRKKGQKLKQPGHSALITLVEDLMIQLPQVNRTQSIQCDQFLGEC